MSKVQGETRHSEQPKSSQPLPDPDSLAMDDRGTRIYRSHEEHRPGRRHIPDDGNYTGDPTKPEETIRADTTGSDAAAPEETQVNDAPTLIRDR